MRTIRIHTCIYFFAFIGIMIFTLACEKEDPMEPPTLTTTGVTEIKGNSAKSGGNITNDGGASVTARGVVWSTSENPTVDNKEGSTSDGIGSGQFTSNITGLTRGETYFVRAYAVSSAGTGYGNQVQFTTIQLASVATAEITEITSTSAKSGGNVTDDGGADITSRGVVWDTEQHPTLEDNEGFTEDGTGTGEFTSELTDLAPGTNYYVRAYVTNSEGTSYGSQLSFPTDASARFLLITGTEWMSDSLLVNGVDASGPGQLLEGFKGDYIFNEDYTGSFGAYEGTWRFLQDYTILEIKTVIPFGETQVPITLVTDIIELTASILKIETNFPDFENPGEELKIEMTFSAK